MYWLKLTYPVVASTCMLARRIMSRQCTALPNDVTSKIEWRQLHSELFGCRHRTLQSHGLFALAKLLLTVLSLISWAGAQVKLLDQFSRFTAQTSCLGVFLRLAGISGASVPWVLPVTPYICFSYVVVIILYLHLYVWLWQINRLIDWLKQVPWQS